jgi:hypothetical protein
MLGLIPKILLKWVTADYGEETALEIRRRAGCPPDLDFRINEVYEDELWVRLVVASLDVLNIPAERLEEGYARYFLKDAQRRWPTWFKMSKNAREFLERHPSIHNNFADGIRDPAECERIKDKFRLERLDNRIVTHYRSPNRHCYLYECLAREVLKLYDEQATIEQPKCVKRGDPECEIWITWDTV